MSIYFSILKCLFWFFTLLFLKKGARLSRLLRVIIFSLTHCADTMIGWPHRLKGISGGERKRLAFASEVI